jgi:multidrug efflux pump subunit AcrA (membrane-fusion protein)
MSELNPEAVAATETPEAPTTETTPAAEAAKPTETVDFWKSKAREQEARAKSNADAARRLAEIEDAQKTEQQRLADRQAQIERERDDARAEGLRYKAAATHGIGEDYFDLLGSGDAESISARAERVGALLRDNASMKAELEALRAGKPAPSNGRPIEALKPGATPSNPTTEDDVLYTSLFGG